MMRSNVRPANLLSTQCTWRWWVSGRIGGKAHLSRRLRPQPLRTWSRTTNATVHAGLGIEWEAVDSRGSKRAVLGIFRPCLEVVEKASFLREGPANWSIIYVRRGHSKGKFSLIN